MSQLSNGSIRLRLYDVLGEDQHRYFVGIIEQTVKGKFLAPIPPVRVGHTGLLIAVAEQIEMQRDLKQKIFKELMRQLANEMIPIDQSDYWYDSPIEAVEACLYQPVTSCMLTEAD